MSLEKHRFDSFNCVRCSNCKWVDFVYMRSKRFSKICPSSSRYLFDAYSAQGRLDIALAIIDGKLTNTPRLVDIIYQCTMCGACDTMCKRSLDLEVTETLEELRVKCVQDGLLPEALKQLIVQVQNSGNLYGQPKKTKFRWAEGFKIKNLNKEKAENLLYVGCTGDYEEEHHKVLKNIIQILTNAKIDFGMLGDEELCCGGPIQSIGDREISTEYARRNIEIINQLGVKRVILNCATCYSMFKSVYPAIGKMNFEVCHTSEFFKELIKAHRLQLKKRVDINLTYHDPCFLGRRGEPYIYWEGTYGKHGLTDPPKEYRRGTYGVYEPPREVLRSIEGVTLIEMERHRENAWCCGAGGGVKFGFPDFALWTSKERLEEAKASNVNTLVTCCPFCERNFKDADNRYNIGINVMDISDVLIQAL
jgi:Fe-S oxidoreductase